MDLGKLLLLRVLDGAKTAGYDRVVFDTLPKLADALQPYEALGFVRIEAYYENALPGAMFFAKDF